MTIKPLKVYTPYEKGQLAFRAGCTVHDYPEEMLAPAMVEWQAGWRASEKEAELRIHKNDFEKFQGQATGDIG